MNEEENKLLDKARELWGYGVYDECAQNLLVLVERLDIELEELKDEQNYIVEDAIIKTSEKSYKNCIRKDNVIELIEKYRTEDTPIDKLILLEKIQKEIKEMKEG